MYDTAYFREQAERYDKLAREFRNQAIAERLEEVADELERRARELHSSRVATEPRPDGSRNHDVALPDTPASKRKLYLWRES